FFDQLRRRLTTQNRPPLVVFLTRVPTTYIFHQRARSKNSNTTRLVHDLRASRKTELTPALRTHQLRRDQRRNQDHEKMKQLLSHWSYSTRMSKKNKLHSMILGPLLGLFHLQSGLLGHKNLMVVVSASAADLVSGGHHDEQLHDKNEDLLVPTTTATATSMLPTPVDDDDDFVNAEDDDESDWDFESCMENERLTRAKFDADRRLPGTEKDVVPSAMLQRKLLPEDTSTAGVLAGAAWNNTSASDEDPSALLQLTERERNEIENKKKKKDCCGPDEKDYSESVEAGKGNACGKCCGKANGKNWAKTMFAKNMRVKVKDSWFKVVENGVYKGRSRGAGYTLAVVKMVRKSDKQPYIMKVYRAIEGPTDTLRKKGDRHKMKHRFNYYRNLRWVTRSVNKYYEDHYRGAEPDGDPAYLHFETLADEAVKMEAPLYFEDLTKKKRARRADERDVIPLSDDKDGAEMMGLLVRSSCPDGIVKPMKDIR
ncbi:unnamed protein product, partial [Amoebophrya sp. A120]